MILAIAVVAHYLPKKWYDVSVDLYVRAPFYAQAAAMAALVIGLQYVAQTGAAPFIYTRFLMRKTILAVVTFAVLILLPRAVPALKNYVSLDPRDIPLVWDLPVPKPKEMETDPIRAPRLQVRAPQNLLDPGKTLDHFYHALLQGGPVRVLHYGDSPTTGDLITADARALFQKQFGDGGAGFVLIAKPWAWYLHRGVNMDSSNWTIDVAGNTQIRDGLHGLGGASFQGSPGAVANFTVKDGQRTAEVAYLEQPEGGAFSFEADGTELGKVETAAETSGEKPRPAWASFELPQGSKKFTVRVVSGTGPAVWRGVQQGQAGRAVQQPGRQRREYHAAGPRVQRSALDGSAASLQARPGGAGVRDQRKRLSRNSSIPRGRPR